MANAERVFEALHDPTRRAVLDRLRSGPKPVGEIARGLPVTRLVTNRSEGTRRIYHIDPKGLGAMRAWLDRYWEAALDALAAELNRTETKEKE